MHFVQVRDRAEGHILFRIHHGLADGVSLSEIFSTMLTNENGAPQIAQKVFHPGKTRGGKPEKVVGYSCPPSAGAS